MSDEEELNDWTVTDGDISATYEQCTEDDAVHRWVTASEPTLERTVSTSAAGKDTSLWFIRPVEGGHEYGKIAAD